MLSVEPDTSREPEVVEVNVRRADGDEVEVGLNAGFEAIEVDPQEPGDE